MSTLEKSKKRSGALSRKLWRVLILVPLMLGAACGMNQGRHMDHGGQGDMHEGMPPQVLDLPPTEGPLDSATFVDTNPDPRIVEVNLEARPAEVEYLPGKRTVAWTYNGALPGPRLEARVGDKVVVNFRNSLPEPTTIHWHGLRIPAEMDGTAAMQSPIPPGGTFQYVFELRDAGTFWYHPHVRSDSQVEKGLYGAIVVRGDQEPGAAVEHVLVLDDVWLNEDGTAAAGDMNTPMLGRQGNVLLVNGRPRPIAQVRAGERQRWRFINAANARFFRLAIPDHKLTLVGVDGGLLEAPSEVDELLLTPGERVGVLFTPTSAPGSQSELVTLPYERGHMTGMLPTANVMRLRYSPEAALTPGPLPGSLRVIAPNPEGSRIRTFKLTEDGMPGMDPTFRINGQAHPDITRLEAKLGETEVWEVENASEMDHPFHLHGFFFQVLSRAGTPEPFRAWKDTVNVPARTTVRLSVRFDGFPGVWMYHCHILEHAERGMTGELNVSP
jgi:FtsP/CotA-like multicopper oxidase with cupredoxin domain